MGKVKNFISRNSRKLKIGAGVLGAGALGYGAYKVGKKVFGRSSGISRRGSVSKLRSRVQRLTLKIKEKQLKRKLFKEELRI